MTNSAISKKRVKGICINIADINHYMDQRSELKLIFTGLITQYSDSGKVFDSYWKEIVEAYSAPTRQYHTFEHLTYVYRQLEQCPQKAANREAIQFALFYHDLVYEIPNTENEERSAEIAAQRMKGLGIAQESIDLCVSHILATKTHKKSGNPDTDLFCDADIAVLGEPPEIYTAYCKKVHAEFKDTPPADFARGRIRELEKLLDMEPMYKTLHFRQKYEVSARRNLMEEIGDLLRGS